MARAYAKRVFPAFRRGDARHDVNERSAGEQHRAFRLLGLIAVVDGTLVMDIKPVVGEAGDG